METEVMDQRFVSMSLDFIEQQKSRMHGAIDDYVNKIVDAGRTWLMSTGNRQCSFMEMCDKINKAVAFLNVKCQEIKCESPSVESSESSLEAVNKFSLFPKSSKTVKPELPPKPEVGGSRERGINKDGQYAMINEIKKELQNILARQNYMDSKLDNKLSDFRKEIDGLNNIVRLINSWSKNGERLKEFSGKLNSLESSTINVSEKIDRINKTLEFLTENQHKNDYLAEDIHDIESSLSDMRTNRQKDLAKVETNYQAMCQLLVDRLRPLEQLRSILNNKMSAQSNNIKQLRIMAGELARVSKTVEQLRPKCTTLLTGFSAEAVVPSGMGAGQIIKPFNSSRCNGEEQFDSTRGVFTANGDGVYQACVSFCQTNIPVQLIHRKKQSEVFGSMDCCVCVVKKPGRGACYMSLVTLNKGDCLFVRMEESSKVATVMTFSCFRLA